MVVLVTRSGARAAVKVTRPGLSVQYRVGDSVIWFDLHCIDQGLRFIYLQRDGMTPSAEGPAAT